MSMLMYKLFSIFLISSILSIVGCETSSEPQTITTNEDDIAAYEAMIEADQQATEEDAAGEDSQ